MNKLSSLARMGIAHKCFGNPIPQQAYDLIEAVEEAILDFNPQLKVNKEIYKGHKSLEDMIKSHISVWRDALEKLHEESTEPDDISYYAHELRALAEIEAAVKVKLGE